MFKSRVSRIIGLVATLTVAAVSFYTATAGAAVPEIKLNLGTGTCYLPTNVAYAGIPAYIGAGSFRVTNDGSGALAVREWLIVVDYNTGESKRSHWVGDYTIPGRSITTFPAASTDLSFRNTSSMSFWATLRVQLDVYANGALVGILAGVPSSFRIWENSGFVTYHDTGRNQSYC